MSPTSDDELETTTDNAYEWQQVKTTKRRKIHTRQVDHQSIDITSSNRFNALPLEESASPAAPENKIPKSQPIFIYSVTNYNEMVNKLSEVVKQEQYSTKSMADNTIKINCILPETYKKTGKFLKENNINSRKR
jgi:hypothetical protein